MAVPPPHSNSNGSSSSSSRSSRSSSSRPSLLSPRRLLGLLALAVLAGSLFVVLAATSLFLLLGHTARAQQQQAAAAAPTTIPAPLLPIDEMSTGPVLLDTSGVGGASAQSTASFVIAPGTRWRLWVACTTALSTSASTSIQVDVVPVGAAAAAAVGVHDTAARSFTPLCPSLGSSDAGYILAISGTFRLHMSASAGVRWRLVVVSIPR